MLNVDFLCYPKMIAFGFSMISKSFCSYLLGPCDSETVIPQSIKLCLKHKIPTAIPARLSYWKRSATLKPEQGKRRRQLSKHMRRKSTSSNSSSDRRRTSLLTSNGSNFCSLKTSTSRLRTITDSQYLPSFR